MVVISLAGCSYANEIDNYVLTTGDLVSAGFKDVRVGVGSDFVSLTRYHKTYYFKYDGSDNPGGTVIATMSMGSCSTNALSGCSEGDNVQRGTNMLVCTKVSSPYGDYIYMKKVRYVYVFNADKCDSENCVSNDCSLITLTLDYYVSYNFTSPDSYINSLNNIMISKIKGTPKDDLKVTILSPENDEVFYYNKGKEFGFTVKAKVEGDYDYVGTHYESNGVMIGGEMNIVGGIAERYIVLKPDEIFSEAIVKVYVSKGGVDKEASVNVYFKPMSSDDVNKDNNMNNNKKQKPEVSKEDVSGKTKNSHNPKNELKDNKKKYDENRELSSSMKGLLNKYKKSKMEVMNDVGKIRAVSSKIEKMYDGKKADKLMISGSKITKLVQKDSYIKKEHPGVKKNTGLWFKIKYGLNKYILNPTIDKIASKLPVIGAYKDYFTDDKDINVFDNDVEKTAKDLNVDKKSAQLYNQMSGIEDKEKSLSVSKNSLVSVPAVGKPMEFAVNAMTMGTKKIIARYYHKEYNYIVKQAKYYRSHGMKWKDIHKRIKEDLEDLEGGFTGLSSAEENAASQYLNTVSKGQYKDIKARADLYILQAMENGELK